MEGHSPLGRSSRRLSHPFSVVLLLVASYNCSFLAATAAAEGEGEGWSERSAWEDEYGTLRLLRARHELSPLVPGAARVNTEGGRYDDTAEELRVVRAMQFAADPSDTLQRRGMAEIASACAAAPQARLAPSGLGGEPNVDQRATRTYNLTPCPLLLNCPVTTLLV
jgi:hypothetical protein